ncbi:MAG: LysR family transcriptional regulator [Rhodospirillaceae bacterium]|nr:LysR family transcriptional regulator [Rhodospirillaceae bacterium]
MTADITPEKLRPQIGDPAWLAALRDIARQHSIAAAAEQIGRSRTAVSLVLAGKYPAKSLTALQTAVEAALNEDIHCPILGQITSNACLDTQNQPFNTTSPQAVKLARTCRACPHRQQGGNNDEPL